MPVIRPAAFTELVVADLVETVVFGTSGRGRQSSSGWHAHQLGAEVATGMFVR